jgi:hypothetical protein
VINNTPNSINKKMNEMYEATYKVVVSNKSQNKALGISKQPWSTQNNMDVETYVPYRTAQMALSHYTRIKIVVSGDPKLSVGKTIRVRIPSNRSKKDGSGLNEGLYDEYNTGVYLISAVRHIIKSDMKYDTVVEVVKDSMGGQLPDWSSSQIVNVVKGS